MSSTDRGWVPVQTTPGIAEGEGEGKQEQKQHAQEPRPASSSRPQQPQSSSIMKTANKNEVPAHKNHTGQTVPRWISQSSLSSSQASWTNAKRSYPGSLSVSSLERLAAQDAARTDCWDNFLRFSVLCGAVPATAVSCLSWATALLGHIGAWQSGTLYAAYTLSAVTVAVVVVQEYGSKRAVRIGMTLLTVYVVSFGSAVVLWRGALQTIVALAGAVVGGLGAGILWTAQGVYFAQASAEYATFLQPEDEDYDLPIGDLQLHETDPEQRNVKNLPSSRNTTEIASDQSLRTPALAPAPENDSDLLLLSATTSTPAQQQHAAATSQLASLFAGIFLLEETAASIFSSLLVRWLQIPYSLVFFLFSAAAIAATVALQRIVKEYPDSNSSNGSRSNMHTTSSRTSLATITTTRQKNAPSNEHDTTSSTIVPPFALVWFDSNTLYSRVTAAFQLLLTDPKLKYLAAWNAAFGFAGAFVNSFVSGQVVPSILHSSSYVGLFTAWHGIVAAVGSASLGYLSLYTGKGCILTLGALAFCATALPFCIQPHFRNPDDEEVHYWHWWGLFLIYTFQGLGRATFEGTYKAVYADFYYQSPSPSNDDTNNDDIADNDKPKTTADAAFANLILQNGIASTVAYWLSFRLYCHGTVVVPTEHPLESSHFLAMNDTNINTTTTLMSDVDVDIDSLWSNVTSTSNITSVSNMTTSISNISNSNYSGNNNYSLSVMSPYCIEYQDGSHHDIFKFAMLVIGTSILGILGYWRASYLFAQEQRQQQQDQEQLPPASKIRSTAADKARRALRTRGKKYKAVWTASMEYPHDDEEQEQELPPIL